MNENEKPERGVGGAHITDKYDLRSELVHVKTTVEKDTEGGFRWQHGS